MRALRTMPGPAPAVRWAAALCLAAALAAGLLAACGGDGEPREHYSRGRVLDVFVTEPETPERIVIRTSRLCDQDESHRLLEATNPNRVYVAVRVRVVNSISGVVPLFVNPGSAQIGDPRAPHDDRIFALDPCAVGEPYDPPGGSGTEEASTHAPLLWGNVDLKKGFQVKGWMFFDVPKTLTLEGFWWQDPETQTIIYPRGQYID